MSKSVSSNRRSRSKDRPSGGGGQRKKSLGYPLVPIKSKSTNSTEIMPPMMIPRKSRGPCNSLNFKNVKSSQSLGIATRRISSISSLASQYNLATGRFTVGSAVKMSETLNSNSGAISQYGQSLYDCVAIYLVCPFHKKLALSKVVNKGMFLPFGPIKTGESWLSASINIIQKMLNNKNLEKAMFSEPVAIDILRIQVPTYFEFITRIIYSSKLTNEACHNKMCNDNSMIAWFAINEINSKISSSDCLGPEPMIFGSATNLVCREIIILDILLFILQGNSCAEGRLLSKLGYKEQDVLKLYGDFLQHCYPSEYMTLYSFKSFLAKWGLTINNEPSHVFRSFAINENRYINFTEFLLGLVTLDRAQLARNSGESSNSNSTTINEFQSGYCYRFYQSKLIDQSFLADSDLQRLIADIKNNSSLENRSKFLARFNNPNIKITKQIMHSILKTLQDKDFKQWQQQMFRCAPTPLVLLKSSQCYPPLKLKQLTTVESKNAIQAKLQRAKEFCSSCRSKNYTLAVHLVKMSNDGVIHEPMLNNQLDVDRMVAHKRILSDRYFTRSFVCNQMIDIIRVHAGRTRIVNVDCKLSSQIQEWESNEVREHCVEKILKICQEARNLFQNCSRVIKVTSPCFVIGDLHGNLHDLLMYEKTIWKIGPYFTPANYLFLGDYVDRGDYSVECILYLLCMKLLVPDRICMLRGNHEARSLQKEFTFYTECVQKFGNRGEEVWEAFNDVFDVMPLCAVIDESIFCAHGGIPSCASKIEQIMQVQSPLIDPENDSEIALEILWNDPVTNQECEDLIKNSPSLVKTSEISAVGFLPNTKRGTACYFSEDALNNFLTANSLSHVIRAHEVIPAGYQYHMSGRCITVFSCSHYCGGINEAAVAFVHDSKIRVIKVETKVD